MNKTFKSYHILAFILAMIQAQTNPPIIDCTLDDLNCPAPDAAGNVPPSRPVCAWFNPNGGNCENKLCNKDVDSVCNACGLDGIIGYSLGPCPQSEAIVERDSPQDTCNDRAVLATSARCSDIYAPYCAYYQCLQDAAFGENCSQTFPNRCAACADPNVLYVVPGECPTKKELHLNAIAIDLLPPIIFPYVNPVHLCPKKICPYYWKPVCGWFDTSQVSCIKYPCAQTYINACFACKDPKVIGYTPGPCPKIYILPPIPVTADPAIAADTTAKAADLSVAVDTTVIAKIPIPPPYPVSYLCTSSLINADCSKYGYDPVCGIILDIAYCKSIGQSTPCYQTYNNSCLACHDPKVHAYNTYMIPLGTCPRAPKPPYPYNLIRCPKKVCPYIYAPVCAIQLPCSHTYANSCFACLNNSTIGYINGPCPHTIPILQVLDTAEAYKCAITDTFRKTPCEPVQGYNYVCAYLDFKCSYGQCTTYYANKCEACGNTLVQKVTPGLCPRDVKWFKNVKSYVCKDSDRQEDLPCPDFDIGVCAIKNQGYGAYPNVCIACKDPDVIEVFNKDCPTLN